MLAANILKVILPKLWLTCLENLQENIFPFVFSDTLTVSSSGAVLSANEVWGALRGLETFSQLVVRDEMGGVSLGPRL